MTTVCLGERPQLLPLGEADVHIWSVHVASPLERRLTTLLLDDERARAERFRSRDDRARFVVTRVALRVLLARYLRIEPSAVHLAFSPHGKPSLDQEHTVNLQFNVSHSGAIAVLAFARAAVGIDVESVRALDVMEVARAACSPPERACLESLPPARRERCFYRIWTAKEAYLKARGEGLGSASDDLDFSWAATRRASVVDAYQVVAVPVARRAEAVVAIRSPKSPTVKWIYNVWI